MMSVLRVGGMVRVVCVLLVAMTATTGAVPEEPGVTVPYTESSPFAEGWTAREGWAGAVALSGFHKLQKGLLEADTTVWMSWDDIWLYLQARCEEPAVQDIRKPRDFARDASFNKADTIEIFIEPGLGDRRLHYLHFTLSADNMQGDQLAGRDRAKFRQWDMPWKSDTVIDVDGRAWHARIALPLALLLKEAGPGPWRFNICRARFAGGNKEYSSYAVLSGKDGFHDPDAFVPLRGLSELEPEPPFLPRLAATRLLPLTAMAGAYSYTLEATVENRTGRGGSVRVHATTPEADASLRVSSGSIALGPDDKETVRLKMPVHRNVPQEATVVVNDAAGEEVFDRRTLAMGKALLPFTCLVERDYYTREPAAVVHVERLVEAGTPDQPQTVTVRLLGAGDQDLNTDETSTTDWHTALRLNIAGLSPGEYPVDVTVRDANGLLLGERRAVLVKREPSPANVKTVQIDRFNRCLLVDGKPFFALGALGYFRRGPLEGRTRAVLARQLDFCYEAGMNCLLQWNSYSPHEHPVDQVKTLFDMAHDRGLKVIARPYSFRQKDFRTHYMAPEAREQLSIVIDRMAPCLEMARLHPAVIGYYHFDEPGSQVELDDVLERFYRTVKGHDPYHPVYMSLTRYIHNPNWFDTTTDLMGAHNYWIPDVRDNHFILPHWYDAVAKHSRKANKPTMHMTQLERFSGTFQLPTREERIWQTFAALVYGAKSVFYFVLPITHRETVEGQRAVAGIVEKLRPALLTRRPRQERTFSPESIGVEGVLAHHDKKPVVDAALLTFPGRGHVLLAMNAAPREAQAAFTVSSLTTRSSVTELLAERPIGAPDQNGMFSDVLEPLAVRAYLLEEVTPSVNGMERIHIRVSGPAAGYPAVMASRKMRQGDLKPGGPNLLPNPSFEQGLEEWDERRPEDCRVVASDSAPAAGEKCLLIEKTGTGRRAHVYAAPVSLRPGSTYRVSGSIRVDLEEGESTPLLALYGKREDEHKPVMAVARAASMKPNQWYPVFRIFDVPGGGSDDLQTRVADRIAGQEAENQERPFRFRLQVSEDSRGKVWFDDLALVEMRKTSAARRNLVANGGFESARAADRPDLWGFLSDVLYLAPDERTIGLSSDSPYEGRFCLRMPKTADSPRSLRIGTLVREPIEPNTLYTVSAWMRADKPGAEARFHFLDWKQTEDIPLTTEWKRYSATVRSTESEVKLPYLFLWHRGEIGTTVYVDAVQVEKGGEVTAYEAVPSGLKETTPSDTKGGRT